MPTRSLTRAITHSLTRNPTDPGAGGGVFDPASLFASGEQGVWYDPSDMSTLFQDSAGTTPVTATGQPVGKMLDKSGNGNHATQATSAARPLLQQDGNGKYYLAFDGVDDTLNITGVPAIVVKTGWYWATAASVDSRSGAASNAIIAGSAGSTLVNANGVYVRSDVVERLTASLRISNGSIHAAQTDAAFVIGTPFFAESRYESGALHISNGTADVSTTFTDASTSTGTNGSIHIMYAVAGKFYGGVGVDVPQTADNKASVQSYLKGKAGITP